LSHCPAAKAASARDKSSSLVGSSLAQPALATAARQSTKINRRYLELLVVILGVTDVAQVGRVLLIMDMLLNLNKFWSALTPTLTCARKTGALLALATRLFNGDCVAGPRAARCRFKSNISQAESGPAHALSSQCQKSFKTPCHFAGFINIVEAGGSVAGIVSASSSPSPGAFFERCRKAAISIRPLVQKIASVPKN
jgi:hypothetical protein